LVLPPNKPKNPAIALLQRFVKIYIAIYYILLHIIKMAKAN